MPLSLQEAIDYGLKNNLGLLLSNTDIGSARGQRWEQLSALLPHVTAAPSVTDSEISVAELGLTQFRCNQNLRRPLVRSLTSTRIECDAVFGGLEVDQCYAHGQAKPKICQLFLHKMPRDLVVLAVGYTYLQGIADEARIETAEAQVATAQALYDQATDRVGAGTSPAIDGLRAKVELQTRQQALIQARNDFAIQKLTVSRVIGLAPRQEFELTDKSPYQPFEGITLDEALKRAYASRSDYQAAMTDLRAAEFSRRAAGAGYLPSLALNADYGAAGSHPSTATQVFDVHGTLSIPIFEGGGVHGDVLDADAKLQQTQERLDNLRAQIDSDVRAALLNLQSSADRVNVARSNIDLADQTLVQSRDRFGAGVTDTVEVVQSQETVASAHEQYIASLYSYNLAKISLARALGAAEQSVKEYFKGK